MSQRVTRDLFAAARDDAPSPVVLDEVWGKIAVQAAIPAAAVGSGVAVKSIVPGAAKVITALALAVAASAALTAMVLGGDATVAESTPKREPRVVERGPAVGARLAESPPRPRVEPIEVLPPLPARAQLRDEVPLVLDETSSLAEEARLVTEARAALVRGAPERALALAQKTRSLPTRALEPEELAIELRAYRALGRADDALATELTLRSRFPSQSLAH
jgi:hypothetical protein